MAFSSFEFGDALSSLKFDSNCLTWLYPSMPLRHAEATAHLSNRKI